MAIELRLTSVQRLDNLHKSLLSALNALTEEKFVSFDKVKAVIKEMADADKAITDTAENYAPGCYAEAKEVATKHIYQYDVQQLFKKLESSVVRELNVNRTKNTGIFSSAQTTYMVKLTDDTIISWNPRNIRENNNARFSYYEALMRIFGKENSPHQDAACLQRTEEVLNTRAQQSLAS